MYVHCCSRPCSWPYSSFLSTSTSSPLPFAIAHALSFRPPRFLCTSSFLLLSHHSSIFPGTLRPSPAPSPPASNFSSVTLLSPKPSSSTLLAPHYFLSAPPRARRHALRSSSALGAPRRTPAASRSEPSSARRQTVRTGSPTACPDHVMFRRQESVFGCALLIIGTQRRILRTCVVSGGTSRHLGVSRGPLRSRAASMFIDCGGGGFSLTVRIAHHSIPTTRGSFAGGAYVDDIRTAPATPTLVEHCAWTPHWTLNALHLFGATESGCSPCGTRRARFPWGRQTFRRWRWNSACCPGSERVCIARTLRDATIRSSVKSVLKRRTLAGG